MSGKVLKQFVIAILLLSVAGSAAFAQKGDKGKGGSSIDPNDKPRKNKTEVAKIFKEWIDKDVSLIITGAEKKAFKQLVTDEEREAFIENFWRRRDPNPDTEENEYREEYYERIAYANENFTSGIPGWKTDRGRIYVAWGKPDGVESHPTGGSYDRPSYEGGGSTTTYPYEVWFYRHLEGVGDGIELEFVDPTSTGEYRIARSPYEKDALATTPGAGLSLGEELGVGGNGDYQNAAGNGYRGREQDQPFRRLEIISALSRAPSIKYADIDSSIYSTDTAILGEDPLDFDLRIDFFRQSETSVITAFTIQTQNKDLAFEDVGGVQTARLNILGRITGVNSVRAGIFEDAVTTTASVDELSETKARHSAYQKGYTLKPGTYKVDVVVRDVLTGKRGIVHKGFTVPRYDNEKLSTSTLILASKLYTLSDREVGEQFTIGDKKVVPNVSGEYKKGESVGIYMQVYNAGIDQTTLRPSVDVEYLLFKGGKEIGRQKEDWSGLGDSGQRLTLARFLHTEKLASGDYEIKISLKDRVTNQSPATLPSGTFTIK